MCQNNSKNKRNSDQQQNEYYYKHENTFFSIKCVVSRRVGSIFIKRTFNECVCVVFFYYFGMKIFRWRENTIIAGDKLQRKTAILNNNINKYFERRTHCLFCFCRWMCARVTNQTREKNTKIIDTFSCTLEMFGNHFERARTCFEWWTKKKHTNYLPFVCLCIFLVVYQFQMLRNRTARKIIAHNEREIV